MPQSQPPQLAGTPLFGSNAPYVEDLYERFLRDPQSVDASWRAFFAQLPASGRPEQAHGPIIAAIASRTQASAARPRATGAAGTTAPCASVTRPIIVPRASCAKSADEPDTKRQSSKATR